MSIPIPFLELIDFKSSLRAAAVYRAYGIGVGIRTLIGRLSDATGYKPAALPLSYTDLLLEQLVKTGPPREGLLFGPSRQQDSNLQSADYKSAALPIMLYRQEVSLTVN